MIKIYFAGSIRSGRDDKAIYAEIISTLGKYGKVLTVHIGDQALTHMGESWHTNELIFERDFAWLSEADVVIAEVSTPSLGVGYEIGKMEGKKPVLCLYREQKNKSLSPMISGNKNITVKKYTKIDDVKVILEKFFAKPLSQHPVI